MAIFLKGKLLILLKKSIYSKWLYFYIFIIQYYNLLLNIINLFLIKLNQLKKENIY